MPGFSDIDEAIESTRPKAAIIATPTFTHYKIATKLLNNGCNILVEKPLVREIEHGNELIKMSKDLGLIISVGHIERHNPVVRRAKAHLENGEWGELITLNSRRVSSFSGRINDVGAILDVGIHDIDNLVYLMNSKPVSVYASGGSFNDIMFEDHANIIVNFENGKSGAIEVNWITPMKVRTLSLTCSNVFVELDFIDQEMIISRSEILESASPVLYPAPLEFKSTKIGLNKKEPLRLEIEDFLQSIEGNKEPLVDASEALQSLKVALGAVESLKIGDVVSIDD